MIEFLSKWDQVPLMEVVDLHDSRRVPLNNTERAARKGPYPYYGANGQVDTIDGFLFDGEFVLLAEDGGYFDDPSRGVAYEVTGKFWVNNHAHILSAKPTIIRRFLTYVLNHQDWMPYVGGSTRLKLTQESMRRVQISLPPLVEQRRIVAKLDGLLERSKTARDELAHIPNLVARYKQAVLAAAFKGDLTADWRMSNHFGAQLFLKECGIDTLHEEYAGPLPKGWTWVAAGSLCVIKGGITLGKKRSVGTTLTELPYLRVANVQRGWLDLDEVKTIAVTSKEAEALYLQPGDVLMNEGGDRDKLGRGWVWDGQISNCIHQNHVFRLRPRMSSIPGRYISYYANEFGQRYFLVQGKQTTNLASISLSKVSALPVPVAPPDEMAVIVQRIESLFSRIDALGTEVIAATALVNRLEQAVLAKAFSGELVPRNQAGRTAPKHVEQSLTKAS